MENKKKKVIIVEILKKEIIIDEDFENDSTDNNNYNSTQKVFDNYRNDDPDFELSAEDYYETILIDDEKNKYGKNADDKFINMINYIDNINSLNYD